MNVTEQSMLSSYASGEILSATQKADNGRPTLSESEAFRNEARSAEKKKTTREETNTT